MGRQLLVFQDKNNIISKKELVKLIQGQNTREIRLIQYLQDRDINELRKYKSKPEYTVIVVRNKA